MPTEKQPKFAVGDVVETRVRIQPARKGIITYVLPNAIGYLHSYAGKRFDNNHMFLNESRELKLCRGMKNTKLCDKCEYRFKCWTSRGI